MADKNISEQVTLEQDLQLTPHVAESITGPTDPKSNKILPEKFEGGVDVETIDKIDKDKLLSLSRPLSVIMQNISELYGLNPKEAISVIANKKHLNVYLDSLLSIGSNEFYIEQVKTMPEVLELQSIYEKLVARKQPAPPKPKSQSAPQKPKFQYEEDKYREGGMREKAKKPFVTDANPRDILLYRIDKININNIEDIERLSAETEEVFKAIGVREGLKEKLEQARNFTAESPKRQPDPTLTPANTPVANLDFILSAPRASAERETFAERLREPFSHQKHALSLYEALNKKIEKAVDLYFRIQNDYERLISQYTAQEPSLSLMNMELKRESAEIKKLKEEIEYLNKQFSLNESLFSDNVKVEELNMKVIQYNEAIERYNRKLAEYQSRVNTISPLAQEIDRKYRDLTRAHNALKRLERLADEVSSYLMLQVPSEIKKLTSTQIANPRISVGKFLSDQFEIYEQEQQSRIIRRAIDEGIKDRNLDVYDRAFLEGALIIIKPIVDIISPKTSEDNPLRLEYDDNRAKTWLDRFNEETQKLFLFEVMKYGGNLEDMETPFTEHILNGNYQIAGVKIAYGLMNALGNVVGIILSPQKKVDFFQRTSQQISRAASGIKNPYSREALKLLSKGVETFKNVNTGILSLSYTQGADMYDRAKRAGLTDQEAMQASILSFTTSYMLETLFAGAEQSLRRNISKAITGEALEQTSRTFRETLKELGVNFIAGGIEEGIPALVDGLLATYMLKEDYNPYQILDEFIIGGLAEATTTSMNQLLSMLSQIKFPRRKEEEVPEKEEEVLDLDAEEFEGIVRVPKPPGGDGGGFGPSLDVPPQIKQMALKATEVIVKALIGAGKITEQQGTALLKSAETKLLPGRSDEAADEQTQQSDGGQDIAQPSVVTDNQTTTEEQDLPDAQRIMVSFSTLRLLSDIDGETHDFEVLISENKEAASRYYKSLVGFARAIDDFLTGNINYEVFEETKNKYYEELQKYREVLESEAQARKTGQAAQQEQQQANQQGQQELLTQQQQQAPAQQLPAIDNINEDERITVITDNGIPVEVTVLKDSGQTIIVEDETGDVFAVPKNNVAFTGNQVNPGAVIEQLQRNGNIDGLRQFTAEFLNKPSEQITDNELRDIAEVYLKQKRSGKKTSNLINNVERLLYNQTKQTTPQQQTQQQEQPKTEPQPTPQPQQPSQSTAGERPGKTKSATPVSDRKGVAMAGDKDNGADKAQDKNERKSKRKVRDERVKGEIDALFDELRKTIGGQLNVGIDPKGLAIGIKIVGKYVESGIYKISDILQDAYDSLGDGLKEILIYIKTAYNAFRESDDTPDEIREKMDSGEVVRKITFEQIQQEYDTRSNTTEDVSDVETSDEVTSGDAVVQQQPGEDRGDIRGDNQQANQSGDRPGGSPDVRRVAPDTVRERGDSDNRTSDGDTNILIARNILDTGRNRSSSDGTPDVSGTIEAAISSVSEDPDVSKNTNIIQQKVAQHQIKQNETARSDKIADLEQISQEMPSLMQGQKEDVAFAENALYKNNKKGVMFTNQTGTGKTILALGIVRRLINRNPNARVLIVTKSTNIINAFIADNAKSGLNIPLYQIQDTKDSGDNNNVLITTYANFRQNKKLQESEFDLVVADESHHIMQSQEGSGTSTYNAFADVVFRNKKISQLRANINYKTSEEEQEKIEKIIKEEKEKTKVVFLSATPFSSTASIMYAKDILFDTSNYQSVNDFFANYFGWKVSGGKVKQRSVSGVDEGLMQRSFHEILRKEGVLSRRRVDTPFDYSRDFVLIKTGENSIGRIIDDYIKGLLTTIDDLQNVDAATKYQMKQIVWKKFSFLYNMMLLEGIKAEASVEFIEELIKRGYRVVIFHNYNKTATLNLTDFNDVFYALDGKIGITNQEYVMRLKKMFNSVVQQNEPILKDIKINIIEPPNIYLSDKLSMYGVGLVNGLVSQKERAKAIKDFNEGNIKVIIVQKDAGKEGISLHDTDGKAPRALVNLGIPIMSTDAIQAEGRIFRSMVKSNAAIFYVVTHLGFERNIFGDKTAYRTSAAENFAFGDEARNLLRSLRFGYTTPVTSIPEVLGVGGKEMDSKFDEMSDYEMAVVLYHSTKNIINSIKETDFFPTPHPVAYMLVSWAKIDDPNQYILEPSAGTGNIARFVPESNKVDIIEPYYDLYTQSKINVINPNANFFHDSFENLNIRNKYDRIIMNPPFGKAGETAAEHLAKAFKHLRNGGRLVALLPMGSAIDKFQKILNETPQAVLIDAIELPDVTFKDYNTRVKTFVLIADYVVNEDERPERTKDIKAVMRKIEAETVDELFEVIKDVDVEDVTEVANIQYGQDGKISIPVIFQDEVAVTDIEENKIFYTLSTRSFHKGVYKNAIVVKSRYMFNKYFFVKAVNLAKTLGGYYNAKYNTKGFYFFSSSSADEFMNTIMQIVLKKYKEKTKGSEGGDEVSYMAGDFMSFRKLNKSTFDKVAKNLSEKFNVRVVTDKQEFLNILNNISPKEREKIQRYEQKGGVVYGAKIDENTIYLDYESLNAEAPVHEFAHLLFDLVPKAKEVAIRTVLESEEGVEEVERLSKEDMYKGKSKEQIALEVAVKFAGMYGAEITEQSTLYGKIKTFIEKVINKIKEILGIKEQTITPDSAMREFAKAVAGEILSKNTMRDTLTRVGDISDDFAERKAYEQQNNIIKEKIMNMSPEVKEKIKRCYGS